MARFPGYRFPFQYYNPYQRNAYRPPVHPPIPPPIVEPVSPNSTNNFNEDRSHKQNKLNDDFWFDIFGIKLYFDDVLILSLLFFLYEEEVKDEGLFLALVMLLIS